MPELLDKRLDNLVRHVENVRDDCYLLGNRLIEANEEDFGLRLIANGRIHDISKFSGIEWEYLNDGAFPRPDADPDTDMFKVALRQHIKTNMHHPEYFDGIKNMPSIYIAEMVVDWKARSNEQGTDLLEWVRDKATSKFKFTVKSRIYKDIKRFAELLLEKKFT